VLREVGTTNRTRARDYVVAVNERTAAFLRVHRSNFAIVGFTETPSVPEMVAAAREAKMPLLYDEGSGRAVDLSRYGFSKGETMRELFDAGIDVVTCSTDKLLGATQGGLILGKESFIDRCRKHPLMRALRAGKESYAIVAATLRAFLSGQYEQRIPVYRMLATPIESLRARAESIASSREVRVVVTESALGGGTTPTETIPSIGIELAGNANAMAAALRSRDIPIIGRIHGDRLVLDLRTIAPEEDAIVEAALGAVR
jgi:Selenocysteine synthase [seryl-tRNASer selenium transferase]